MLEDVPCSMTRHARGMQRASGGVPPLDLARQLDEVAPSLRQAFERVLASGCFILGPEVDAFEAEFADFSGTSACVAVGNGTDAIELGLRALGVGPGDEVIVPALTFIATALAVLRLGARPCIVDVDAVHLLIDPEAVSAGINSRTRAIVPVHLYGQPAPCELLPRIGGIPILEDAAQAQGATRLGQPVGALGRLAATSFYPGKNLGALGDGGAVITDDESLATRLRALRNYGSPAKYSHPDVGFNSRLDEIQAAFLRVRLPLLERDNAARSLAAERYENLLGDLSGLERPSALDGNTHVWHVYAVRLPSDLKVSRDEVLRRLKDAKIGASVHYPLPLHLNGALSALGYVRGCFPIAEDACARLVSLPIFPEISEAEQEQVARSLAEALKGAGMHKPRSLTPLEPGCRETTER